MNLRQTARARRWSIARSGERYYGWRLVTVVALAQVTSWGVLYYAFSVLLTPMEAELGWSRGAMTGAFSLAILCSGVTGVLVGRWLDRRGPRAVMTVGSIAASLLVVAWSRVDDLTSFYLVWAGIGVAMAATLYEPAFWIVAVWFRRDRARALTLLTLIAGCASVVYTPLVTWLVELQGWRDALQTLAVLLAVGTILPHALVLRRRPEDLGLRADGAPLDAATGASGEPEEPSVSAGEAVRGAAFRWVAVAFFIATLTGGVVMVHLIPYLRERGHSAGFAAAIIVVIGLMTFPGRGLYAPLRSRFPGQRLTAAIFVGEAVALLVLVLAPGAAGAIAFAVLFGGAYRAMTMVRASVVTDLYGPAAYGAINGVLAFCLTIAQAAAPVGAGLLYDAAGSYRPVFWGLAAASLVAIGAVAMISRSTVSAAAGGSAGAPQGDR